MTNEGYGGVEETHVIHLGGIPLKSHGTKSDFRPIFEIFTNSDIIFWGITLLADMVTGSNFLCDILVPKW